MNLSNATRPPRIMAVFAHPDDETYCAGGTLAMFAAQGSDIMVVSATRGDAGQIHDANIATRRTLGQIRERELKLACEQLGVGHALCLPNGDGTLERIELNVLARHIARLIRRFRPDIVLTFGPDGVYGHPDHIAIGAATGAACVLAGTRAAFPCGLSGRLAPHTPEALYHSYFPRQRSLLRDMLAGWLAPHDARFRAPAEAIRALPLLALELSTLGCVADHVDVQWYADGFAIVEQGEPAARLHLILDGAVDLIEDRDGTPRTVAQLGPGSFFGQQELAYSVPSSTNVVASGSATCLVLAPGAPTAFAGRGTGAAYLFDAAGEGEAAAVQRTTAIDVSAFVERKVAALAAHRTQCPVTPELLPAALFEALLGREYFVRVDPVAGLQPELLRFPCTASTTQWAYRAPALAA